MHEPKKEHEAALGFLLWLREQLAACGRAEQPVLFVGDGHYDHLSLWQGLPEGVTLLARSAKNRVLYHLPSAPPQQRGRKRLYGERAATPQPLWQERRGWQALTLNVRGRERHLQVKVRGGLLRQGVPHRPLFLIVVRGRNNQRTRREPLAFLVNRN